LGAGTTDLFTSGRGAMLVNGRWGAFFINVAKEKRNWRAVTYPTLKPGGNTAYTYVALSIPASSKHPDEAWEFIKFVVGPEGQRINAATGIGMPVRKDITQEPVWLVPGESKDSIDVFAKGMETARVLPFNPRWTEVIDDLAEKTLDPVWRGEITAAQGAKQVCEKINPLLSG
ncbi:MAG: extracellular solute-binding protein, partial [Anaerolineae bacterium]|nr:extracellular solute-binding protein [Anaerolineae bacterium]